MSERTSRILVLGEVLWDCFADKRTLGGASLNFAVHSRRLGHPTLFISAVGDDALGREARGQILAAGLEDGFVQTTARFPTGCVSVFVDGAGQPDFTIHRPAAYDAVDLHAVQLEELAAWKPDWLYYGTLSYMADNARDVLYRLMAAVPRARRFYDINLRKDSYTAELVRDLMSRAGVIKLNAEEMQRIGRLYDLPVAGFEEFCRVGAARYGWDAVAVTLGEAGCAVWIGGDYAEVAGVPVKVADTVGAGDAFAAAFVHGLSQSWGARETGVFANKVGALVASRPGGTPEWVIEEVA